ncbi:MAG: hypothetical protein WEC75_08480 [Dehalococcoidia bacterium]
MDVTLALIADAANVSRENKLNILGAFGNINAREFPATWPRMVLVLSLEASSAEVGTKKQLEIRILDADGAQVRTISGAFTVPSPRRPGHQVRLNQIVQLINVTFPHPGDYVFAVLLNGDTKREIPLTCTLLEPPPPQPGPDPPPEPA